MNKHILYNATQCEEHLQSSLKKTTSNMISTQCHKASIWGWLLNYYPFTVLFGMSYCWLYHGLPHGAFRKCYPQMVWFIMDKQKPTLTIYKWMIWGYPSDFFWKAPHSTRHRLRHGAMRSHQTIVTVVPRGRGGLRRIAIRQRLPWKNHWEIQWLYPYWWNIPG